MLRVSGVARAAWSGRRRGRCCAPVGPGAGAAGCRCRIQRRSDPAWSRASTSCSGARTRRQTRRGPSTPRDMLQHASACRPRGGRARRRARAPPGRRADAPAPKPAAARAGALTAPTVILATMDDRAQMDALLDAPASAPWCDAPPPSTAGRFVRADAPAFAAIPRLRPRLRAGVCSERAGSCRTPLSPHERRAARVAHCPTAPSVTSTQTATAEPRAPPTVSPIAVYRISLKPSGPPFTDGRDA